MNPPSTIAADVVDGHRLVQGRTSGSAWCECASGPVWWGGWTREEIEAQHREHLAKIADLGSV